MNLGERPAKQPRLYAAMEVVRATNPSPPSVSQSLSDGALPPAEESATPSTQPLPETSQKTLKKTGSAHPKGHRVHELGMVFGIIDASEYLRCTDTYALNDVWSVPSGIEEIVSKGVLLVKFYQIVTGYHIKSRITVKKIAADDLLRMFYILNAYSMEFRAATVVGYDDWLNSMIVNYVREVGEGADVSNRAQLCKYIFENKITNFAPCPSTPNLHLFFRKASVHSYKGKKEGRLNNHNVMKCRGARGTFEYIIEGRLIWYRDPRDDEAFFEDPPATQPMSPFSDTLM